MEKFFVGVAAGVSAAIAAKDFGRVVGGVEADADEMSLLVEGWVGGKRFVDIGEVVAHARTEVCELATCVDEGHQHDLAFELVEVNRAVALVKEFEVWHDIALGGNVISDRRLEVGACLRDDDDIFEPDICIAVPLLVCEDFRCDVIAGMKLADDGGIGELVVHGHRFHEA